jgi:hypothetical protein
MDFFTPFLVG